MGSRGNHKPNLRKCIQNSMSIAILPPPVDLSVDTKKAVIDGLKKVIESFQAKGVLDKAISYADIIHEPEILHGFIQTYRKNRELVDDLVIGPDKKPVRDERVPLVCGVTLEQVQQLLVKTCAKFYFEKERGEEETIVETVTTKRFLFFKKTEQVERKAGPTADDRKNREILRYLAFDWQLPLLQALNEDLIYQQVAELGDDLVALKSPEAVRAIAEVDPPTIKKAKQVAGQDFVNILVERPSAVVGVAAWSRDLYVFYRGILGSKAFDFFNREKHFFNVVASLDKPLARVYGDVLCYIAAENLLEMQRLNIDKAGVLIEALRASLGENIQPVMSIPNFSKDILRRLVESLLHMGQEKDQLLVSTTLTCKAIAPQILDWLAKQKAA